MRNSSDQLTVGQLTDTCHLSAHGQSEENLRGGRKIVAAKKIKELLEWIKSRLQLAMKSEKYVPRYKQPLKMIKQGKAKPVILANNCLALRKSELEYYDMLANHHSDNNTELGISVKNTTEYVYYYHWSR
uniref:Ribosomal protein eL8/eL30/eS12/Gadd45 domain-containing protein n=1 Tax=Pipistrellus kuhlii TaxID=59472 RepID=A0A7J8B2F4_PIPKU|nr:hypothetical protein mPipKuh1_007841 [Pipistrellus kuhlii]